MEVQFSPELQEKLNRIATKQGRDSQSLVQEAVERLVDYDEWFLREVQKGLAAADRGEFVEHDEIHNLIDSAYRSSVPPRTQSVRRLADSRLREQLILTAPWPFLFSDHLES